MRMGKLTGKTHGDAANELFAFYGDRAIELEESRQFYMAAVSLAFALETASITSSASLVARRDALSLNSGPHPRSRSRFTLDVFGIEPVGVHQCGLRAPIKHAHQDWWPALFNALDNPSLWTTFGGLHDTIYDHSVTVQYRSGNEQGQRHASLGSRYDLGLMWP